MANKLVVLGIPWDVETEGLRDYMSKFGELDDCIVMRERSTGRSRGFGYVTFSSSDDAKAVLAGEHMIGNRSLELKVATPKEEMRSSSKKVTRVFVARIPSSVTETTFRSYFEVYGDITDLYMPKDPVSKGHRGIGFVTFSSAESVDKLMTESHELGGSTIVVDRATPKEEDSKPASRVVTPFGGGGGGGGGGRTDFDGYGSYMMPRATRYAAMGTPTLYDQPPSIYAKRGEVGGSQQRGVGNKIFVGKLPQEATVDDLRLYFNRFGRIEDVYVPKDPKRSGHRGFGFVTFFEDGVADRVSRRPHEICGHLVAIDTAAPLEEGRGVEPMRPAAGGGGHGPVRGYGRVYGNSTDPEEWGYGGSASGERQGQVPRMGMGVGMGMGMGMEWRYRPY